MAAACGRALWYLGGTAIASDSVHQVARLGR